jgi:AbrB family looped-hinge helix DNA binding protein
MGSRTFVDIIPPSCQVDSVKVRVTANGRIVIPAAVRNDLGIKDGDDLLLVRDGETIRLLTYAEAIRRAQDRVARYVEPGSHVDDFIREREDEARQEAKEIDEWHGRRSER